jgi:hypothetical protein
MNTNSKRRLSRVILVAFALLLISPATLLQAQDSAPLTELAQYFPAETYFYASFRTDDATIDTLDTIYQHIMTTMAVTSGTAPQPETPMSLRQALDAMFLPGIFANDTQPWLGDQGAVGRFDASILFTPDARNSPYALVLEITDRQAATNFVQTKSEGIYSFSEEVVGDFTVIRVIGSPAIGIMPSVLIGDSVLIITNDAGEDWFTARTAETLSNQPAFNDTMRSFTTENYTAALYIDMYQLVGTAFAMRTVPEEQQNLAKAMRDAVGQYALGFTLVDNRALTFDMLWNVGDMTPFANSGVRMTPLGNLHPDLLVRVPEDAGAVIRLANVGAAMRFWYDYLKVATGYDPSQPPNENPVAYAETVLTGLTDLDVEDDIFNLMQGDLVFFQSYAPPASIDSSFNESLKMGWFAPIQFEDAEKAWQSITAQAPLYRTGGMTVTEEIVAGTHALVLTQPDVSAQGMVLAVNNDVIAIGARSSVETILQANGNFQNNGAFTDASQYMLPDSSVMIYVGQPMFIYVADSEIYTEAMIAPIFANVTASLSGSPTPEFTPTPDFPAFQAEREAAHQAVRSLLHSMSFTAGSTPEGDVRARLVVLLVE